MFLAVVLFFAVLRKMYDEVSTESNDIRSWHAGALCKIFQVSSQHFMLQLFYITCSKFILKRMKEKHPNQSFKVKCWKIHEHRVSL